MTTECLFLGELFLYVFSLTHTHTHTHLKDSMVALGVCSCYLSVIRADFKRTSRSVMQACVCVCVCLLKLSEQWTNGFKGNVVLVWPFPFSTISADQREHCGPPECRSSLFLLDFDVFVKLHFLQSSLVQTIKQYFHVSRPVCVCVCLKSLLSMYRSDLQFCRGWKYK